MTTPTTTILLVQGKGRTVFPVSAGIGLVTQSVI